MCSSLSLAAVDAVTRTTSSNVVIPSASFTGARTGAAFASPFDRHVLDLERILGPVDQVTDDKSTASNSKMPVRPKVARVSAARAASPFLRDDPLPRSA